LIVEINEKTNFSLNLS